MTSHGLPEARVAWHRLSQLVGIVLIGLILSKLPRLVGVGIVQCHLRRLDEAIELVPQNAGDVAAATFSLLSTIDRWRASGESPLTSRLRTADALTRAGILTGVGRHHASQGRLAEGLQAYREAITADPYHLADAACAELRALITELEPTDSESRSALVRCLIRAVQAGSPRDELLSAVQSAADWDLSDALIAQACNGLGASFEADGNTSKAIAQYEQAVEHDDRLIAAMARLALLYAETGDARKAGLWQRRLAGLQPEYIVAQDVGEGWQLVGYDLDEQALEAGTEIELVLYWKPELPQEPSVSGWYCAGERLLQVTRVRNLAPNGGFENDDVGAVDLPSGWNLKVGSSAELPALVMAERAGQMTQVASLSGEETAALCGEASPLDASAAYLLAAWMRSDGATAGDVGCQWYVDGKAAWTYVDRLETSAAWTHRAAIQTLAGATSGCWPCVFKREEWGAVQFDDVFLVELGLPGGET